MATPSEARPRQFPIVNPELAVALLRRIVTAWDAGRSDSRADFEAFCALLDDARTLLRMPKPGV